MVRGRVQHDRLESVIREVDLGEYIYIYIYSVFLTGIYSPNRSEAVPNIFRLKGLQPK